MGHRHRIVILLPHSEIDYWHGESFTKALYHFLTAKREYAKRCVRWEWR